MLNCSFTNVSVQLVSATPNQCGFNKIINSTTKLQLGSTSSQLIVLPFVSNVQLTSTTQQNNQVIQSCSTFNNSNNSSHITLVNNQQVIRGNTRHILACNVANRSQCLITTAVPMRALRIQAPLIQNNILSGVNTSVKQWENITRITGPDNVNKHVKFVTNMGVNAPKVEAVKSTMPSSLNAMAILNTRPSFITKTIQLNPQMSIVAGNRSQIRQVEIKQPVSSEEMGKTILSTSLINCDGRFTGHQNVSNLDNKIVVSTVLSLSEAHNSSRAQQNTDNIVVAKTKEIKMSDATIRNLSIQVSSLNSKSTILPQNIIHLEGGKILAGQNVINLMESTLAGGSVNSGSLFSSGNMMNRMMGQVPTCDGSVLVVSQNIGQQFTALQNKGMVVSGLKLPAYIDLRQVTNSSDNLRSKKIENKSNRPTAFNPCSNRSKDANSKSQINEKDSQELERVMDILKHYKQQISCDDQVSAHFLQPCKRKRSKPGESVVGTLTTSSATSMSSTKDTDLVNHLTNSTTSGTFEQNFRSSLNSSSIAICCSNLVKPFIVGSSFNTSFNNISITTNGSNGAVSSGSGRAQNCGTQMSGGSTKGGLLLSFRPSLVSLLQQPISKMFQSDVDNKIGATEQSSKDEAESKENVPINSRQSLLPLDNNEGDKWIKMDCGEGSVSNNKANDDNDDVYFDDDDDDDSGDSYICSVHGLDVLREFLMKTFNLKLEDLSIYFISSFNTGTTISDNTVKVGTVANDVIRTVQTKLICLLEDISVGRNNKNGAHHSCVTLSCQCPVSHRLFGILFDANFIPDFKNKIQEVMANKSGAENEILLENLDYSNCLRDLFKLHTKEIFSQLMCTQNLEKYSDICLTKQETIECYTCIILAAYQKLNPIQYLTIPNYYLLNNQNASDIKISDITTTFESKSIEPIIPKIIDLKEKLKIEIDINDLNVQGSVDTNKEKNEDIIQPKVNCGSTENRIVDIVYNNQISNITDLDLVTNVINKDNLNIIPNPNVGQKITSDKDKKNNLLDENINMKEAILEDVIIETPIKKSTPVINANIIIMRGSEKCNKIVDKKEVNKKRKRISRKDGVDAVLQSHDTVDCKTNTVDESVENIDNFNAISTGVLNTASTYRGILSSKRICTRAIAKSIVPTTLNTYSKPSTRSSRHDRAIRTKKT